MNLVTAVWGEAYARLFVNLLLRTLIADRNLPGVRGRCDIRYQIYTNAVTAAMLESSPHWASLRKAIDIDIVLHDIQYRDPIGSHHNIWAHALDHARTIKAAVIFIAPDTMWSNGSISHLVGLFEAGHAAVFFPGFRVGNDTFYNAMMQEFPGEDGGPIVLSSTELMDRAMRHMHPLKTVFLRHSTMYPDHMENLLWPVNDEGYVLREYITHTLFGINPSAIDVNNYSVPVRADEVDRIHWVTGSDDVLFVSLGPMARDQHWYEFGGPVDANHVAMKSLELDSAIVPPLIQRRFRFHSGIRDESAWRAAERASDLFTHRVKVARETIRIWRRLDQEGCTVAGQLLLVALYGRSLTHAVSFDSPVTVFCPVNEGLPAIGDSLWNRVAQDAPAHALRKLVLSHVVAGRHDLKTLEHEALRSAAGSALTVRRTEDAVEVNGARVLRRNVVCGEHLIHFVDAPLTRLAA